MRRALRLVVISMSLGPPLLAAPPLRVASVGGRTIDSSEFEARARLVAPDQWAAWGSSWEQRRRRFLEEVLVSDALLELEGGKAEHETPSVRDAALARLLLAELQAEVAKVPPSRAQIDAYYEQHRREYETPAAIQIWRILVREENDARDIIGQLAAPTAADFSRLARDRSVDDATFMRAGNLGFVAADGQTEMPELRVSRALFEAASQVRDGEIVKQPVPEGGKFAVVWRRASRPGRRRSVEQARPAIEQRLFDTALAARMRELVERLRRDGLRDHHPEIAASFEPQFPEQTSVTAGTRDVPSRNVRLRPEPGDDGLR